MNRISSLFVASTLAVLPISAFAQQTAAPVKTAPPATMTTTAPVTTAPAPVAGRAAPTPTADVARPAKPDVKTPAAGSKSEVHGMNTVRTHHAKTSVPTKSAEPAKS
jgi:hypothetical protein